MVNRTTLRGLTRAMKALLSRLSGDPRPDPTTDPELIDADNRLMVRQETLRMIQARHNVRRRGFG